MAALEAMVEGAVNGRGAVVGLVGSPGIGKSRTARETAALAAGRGVEVVWTFCESHARDIALRRRAEQATVLATELRWALVPHTAAGAARVDDRNRRIIHVEQPEAAGNG